MNDYNHLFGTPECAERSNAMIGFLEKEWKLHQNVLTPEQLAKKFGVEVNTAHLTIEWWKGIGA